MTELGEIKAEHKLKQMRRVQPSPSVGTLPQSTDGSPIQQKQFEIGLHPSSQIDKVKSHNQLSLLQSQLPEHVAHGHVGSEIILSENNLDQVTSNISSNLARPSVQHVGKRQLSHDQQNSALTQVYTAIAVKNQMGGKKQSRFT